MRIGLTRAAMAAAALYVAAFLVLTLSGRTHSPWVVGAAVVFLWIAAILLQLVLTRVRAERLLVPRRRLQIPLAIMGVGVLLVGFWGLGIALGFGTGAAGVSGLYAFFLGAGLVLAELRSRTGGAPLRGLTIIAICAAVFAAGVLLCLTIAGPWLALCALAVFAGPPGLTLLSEDVLRAQPWPRWRGAAGGLVLVLAGAVLLIHWSDIPAPFPWVLVGALLVLVGAIASNTQADVLLVTSAIAVFAVTSPQEVTPSERIDETPGQPTLVALGDSYMSGEGAKTYFDGTSDPGSNQCRRARTAWAHRATGPASGTAFRRLGFFACSGARARHVHLEAQFEGEPPDDGTPDAGATQVEQLEALLEPARADVRLVVVSIGGNDARFSNIGKACLAPGSCVERGQRWLDRLDEVAVAVKGAYDAVRATLGPEVPIVAIPYPQPISERSCPASLLDDDEHQLLSKFLEQLNGTIRQAARDAGIYYLDDMAGAFSDRLRICDGPTKEMGVNFIAVRSVRGVLDEVVYPGHWIHNSLHPNERGHEAMAKVFTDWLEAHPRLPGTPEPQDRPKPFTRTTLDGLMTVPAERACGTPGGPDYCDREDVSWALTQIGLVVRDAAIPALLVAGGWWLVWLWILGMTRPRFERRGRAIAQRRLGPPPSGDQAA